MSKKQTRRFRVGATMLSWCLDRLPMSPSWLTFARSGERLPTTTRRYRLGLAWDNACCWLCEQFPEHWQYQCWSSCPSCGVYNPDDHDCWGCGLEHVSAVLAPGEVVELVQARVPDTTQLVQIGSVS